VWVVSVQFPAEEVAIKRTFGYLPTVSYQGLLGVVMTQDEFGYHELHTRIHAIDESTAHVFQVAFEGNLYNKTTTLLDHMWEWLAVHDPNY
jgi:hypothetical protein